MRKKILVSLVCFTLLFNSFSFPVYAKEDYLSITLADIVITYFNATGVAIGETELFNAIQNLWGNVTLNDLVENNVLVAEGVNWTKDDIKNMIGYGNLSVPFVKVNQRNLKNYLGEVPISNVAHDALEAMFAFDSPVTDGIFSALAIILGDVANIGRMGYDLVSDVVLGFTDIFPISTLKQAYQKFTDSTYFQNLLQVDEEPTEGVIYGILDNGYVADEFPGVTNFGAILDSESNKCCVIVCPENVYPVFSISSRNYFQVVNVNDTGTYFEYSTGTYNSDTKTIALGGVSRQYIHPHDRESIRANFNILPSQDIILGYAIGSDTLFNSGDIVELATPYNPWLHSGGGNNQNNGVTNYINNQVGNIASDNYINLNPNIGTNEYINIFDRIAYIENLNQIENNTDNGNYSQNSTVINNYNNQYIQNIIPTVRPSTAPAQNPAEQPAQPFVSPRPTQTPEFVESVVQEGGLSSEITTKFPFCIPWDIKALIDNLWAPEARAPYIHWDAEFGSWGKLGEVDIDLSEYDDVARIFRSTTLLLWIVGLIVITRNLIG